MTFTDLLFSFEGRAARRHYWVVGFVLFLLQLLQGAIWLGIDAAGNDPVASIAFLMANLAISVVIVWISFAIIVKRYHDRGKSGWWWFIIFIPILGFIWQLIELPFLAGDEGGNAYGQPV